MSIKFNYKNVWSKRASLPFFRMLKQALKNAFATQERVTVSTAKTIGKALASFDEVKTLKMPSSNSGTTSVKQTSDTSGVSQAMGAIGAGAALGLADKASVIMNLIKALGKLPGILLNLISPTQSNISLFGRINGIFRQTELNTEGVQKKTAGLAASAARLSGAWADAVEFTRQWQNVSKGLINTDQVNGAIKGVAAQVGKLAGGFAGCNVAALSALDSIKLNWKGLNTWFRTNVAKPMVDDTNALLKGISSGFNQMASSSSGGAISYFPTPKIPHLAQGAVLPANRPFLAMVGDQRNGTNVEAPLETIKQAVAEVAGRNDVVIRFDGDLAQLARVLRPAIVKENTRVGGSLIKKEVL